MAINAYTGLMGSGKSYEVVENVILPALLVGRRVVTNVANLQQDDIFAYLAEKFDVDQSKFGRIVQVVNDDVEKPDFFPEEVKAGEIALPSIVLPGDLVVIDECWRWWSAGVKITPAHLTFFRMHRHFVNPETKVTCDMVLVVQDISDLDRKLKVVVENTYRMSKHKALGSTSRYRVDVFNSYKTTRAPFRSLQRKYNKEIFALYQSYSQGGENGGKEVAIDGRANIFKGALFRLVLPLFLLVFVLCFWWLWRFFHPVPKAEVKPVSVASSSTPLNPVLAKALPPQLPESDWKVSGDFRVGYDHYVVISRAGRLRTLINPRGFYYDGLRASGLLDGNVLANHTGSNDHGFLGETKK